jgi:hypothetical protein
MPATGNGAPRRGVIWVAVPSATLFAKIELALHIRWAVVSAERERLDQLQVHGRSRSEETPALLIATLQEFQAVTSARHSAPTLLICNESEIRALSTDDCDDVLVAPWSSAELRYRVSRMTPMRRCVIDGVRIKWDRRSMTIHFNSAAVTIELSPKQYAILDTLLRNNRPVSREALRHMASLSVGRSFDMQLSRIRAKLASVEAQLAVSISVEGDRAGSFFLAVSKNSIS